MVNPAEADGPDFERLSSIQSHMMAAEGVREVRPEFYMFIDADPEEELPIPDTLERTWGVAAVKAIESGRRGAGVRIAVLDTGFDFDHPDYAGRTIQRKSFVPNESAQDVQGHGTHCVGSAAGSEPGGLRYGVAPDAEIFVGKVLNNAGSGREGWILEGMQWAIQNGCQVISMSLGRAVAPGEAPDPVYENAGEAALGNGCLIIAAAGNDSARQFNFIAPVNAPANSPSIMAIGAVDSAFAIARFSCGGINPNGGEVNLAGPGVDVYSSAPMPMRYRRLSGTSMATPHAAGVAALWAEETGERGRDLWNRLVGTARDIGLTERDGGAGLVQSPSGGKYVA